MKKFKEFIVQFYLSEYPEDEAIEMIDNSVIIINNNTILIRFRNGKEDIFDVHYAETLVLREK